MIPIARRLRTYSWILLPILVSAPALGQAEPVELSLLAAPGGAYSESEGFELDSAYGVGLGFGFATDWQVEVRALLADSDRQFEEFEQRSFELGLRRFLGSDTWRPFLQAGARFRESEVSRDVVCIEIQGPCPPEVEQREEFGPFVGAGVDLELASWFALRGDGRLNFYDSDATGDVENDVDLTVGAVFRF
jgi:hypothetical protein